jgi:hypothetical protein
VAVQVDRFQAAQAARVVAVMAATVLQTAAMAHKIRVQAAAAMEDPHRTALTVQAVQA